MLKFVLQRVLQLDEADDWEKMPPWKTATDRLIEETKIMDEPARTTAGALTGALLGSYWGVGTINSFCRNRLANLDGYFSRGQWWLDLLGFPLLPFNLSPQPVKFLPVLFKPGPFHTVIASTTLFTEIKVSSQQCRFPWTLLIP